MEISGKRAIVVGEASGFGRATAEALTKRGASVAILDRAQSEGKDVAATIGAAFHEVDVTDFAGTEHMLNQAIEDPGRPHNLDSLRATVDLNLIGTLNIGRHAGVSRCSA
jgi:NAD(P)-dependent dehydrogenase (short-subunit alcohol dehydrogenase family)